jgi:uncharacterized membrane protein
MHRINRLDVIIFVGLVLANISYFFSGIPFWIITLTFFCLVPGYLCLKSMRIVSLEASYTICLSAGLSLFILIASGLFLNTLSYFGLHKYLNVTQIFVMLDLLVALLASRNRKELGKISIPEVSLRGPECWIVILSSMLPMLAIVGAIRLNNGSSNIITMALFLVISLMFIWLATHPELKRIYAWSIFCMALSVLLSASSRGWFVTGSDIQREFYVFNLTFKNSHWSMTSFKDPYNACLSITILPTMLAKITHIPLTYIYKLIYQIIFSLSVVIIYILAKRIRNNSKFALFSGFLFMLFPLFITDITIVNRQEIAFIFLFLAVLVNFTSEITKRQSRYMTLILLVGVIASHYSTAYITLVLLLIAKIISFIYYRVTSSSIDLKTAKPIFSLRVIIVALLLTFMWNAQVTNTTGGLTDTFSNTFHELFDQSATQLITFNPLGTNNQPPQQLLSQYTQSSSSSNQSPISYSGVPHLQTTELGKQFNHFHLSAFTLNTLLKQFCASIMEILLALGIVLLFARVKKYRKTNTENLLFLGIAGICILLFQTVLPQLTNDYGTSRLFQQLLIVLVFPICFGLFRLFTWHKITHFTLAAIFLALIFLDLSGFIPQLLGGYPPTIPLDNSGLDYESYYIHHDEIDAAEWLVHNDKGSTPVEIDNYAKLRFRNLGTSPGFIVQPVLSVNNSNYLYEDYSNVKTNTFQVELGNGKISYTLQDKVSNSKNVVYVNGGSEIFK